MFFYKECPKVEKPVPTSNVKLPPNGVYGETLRKAVAECAGKGCYQRMYLRNGVVYYTIGRKSREERKNCVIYTGDNQDCEIEPGTIYTSVSVASMQWHGNVVDTESSDDETNKAVAQFAKEVENAINAMTGKILFAKFE